MVINSPTEKSNRILTPTLSKPKAGKVVRRLKPGSYLFRAGDEANRVYQVVSGVLRLTCVLKNGHRQVIAFSFPGDFVGFSNGTEHSTECDVLETARVIPHRWGALDNGTLDRAMHQQLMQAALREIMNMQEHLVMVGGKTSVARIASFLSVLAERLGEPFGQYTKVTLPMSRSDIAGFLGLSTETVSRAISQICTDNLVARENANALVILKPAALKALAGGGFEGL